MQYYIRNRGRVEGPFDTDKLRMLARRGQFSRLHEVSTDAQQWSAAKNYPELFAPAATPVAAATHAVPATQAAASTPPVAAVSASGFAPARPHVLPMSGAWYYAYGGQEHGPVDQATLMDLIASRRLAPDTDVWCEELANWTPAHAVSALAAPALTPTIVAGPTEIVTKGKPSSSEEVAPNVIRVLADSRPWVVFIAVMGFIYAGLLLLSGIIQVIAGSRMAVFPITAGGLLNMGFSVVVGVGAFMLISHAGGIAQLERTRRDESLRSTLASLKAFWVFVGILLIVVLVIIVLAGILLLSLAGSVPGFSMNSGGAGPLASAVSPVSEIARDDQ